MFGTKHWCVFKREGDRSHGFAAFDDEAATRVFVEDIIKTGEWAEYLGSYRGVASAQAAFYRRTRAALNHVSD